MKKVLHIVRLAEGGMQKHVLSLIQHIDSGRFSLAVTAAPDFIDSADKAVDFLPVEIGDDLKPSSLTKSWQIAGFTRRSGVDIIHAHGYKAAVVGALASFISRKPFVFTAHNLLPSNAGRQAVIALRFCAFVASKIIAVSNEAAERLIKTGVPGAKIVVIPNGIDLTDYDVPVDRGDVRRRLGISGNDKMVVCVARLTRVKGVNYLIEAVPGLLREVPQAKVVIVGSGPDENALNMLATVAAPGGTIKLLGYREDAVDIMAAADVVAIPSIEEGQSIVALEAMALRCPIVASAVGGLKDSIQDGTSGVLVPPADAAKLAQALIRLIREPELSERLGTAGRQKVEADLTMKKMIEHTEELYSCVAR